jgi:hypothetical protein
MSEESGFDGLSPRSQSTPSVTGGMCYAAAASSPQPSGNRSIDKTSSASVRRTGENASHACVRTGIPCSSCGAHLQPHILKASPTAADSVIALAPQIYRDQSSPLWGIETVEHHVDGTGTKAATPLQQVGKGDPNTLGGRVACAATAAVRTFFHKYGYRKKYGGANCVNMSITGRFS